MHARAHNESTALHPTFTPMFIAFLLFERSIQVQVASAGSAATALLPGPLCRVTLNQAAYSAGTKKIVSSVAIVRPPMIAIAIGPQNTLRVSGIIASNVAIAVRTTGPG